MVEYIIHTDGAYSRMHDEGAFAYVICNGNDEEIKRNAWKISQETNNHAELKAIIAALHHLPVDAKKVKVESDSQYALNTLFGGWARNKNLMGNLRTARIVGVRSQKMKRRKLQNH